MQKCLKSKASIEEEYKKCATELKLKTEELVKLSSEVKDLQEIVNLRSEMEENLLEETHSKKQVEMKNPTNKRKIQTENDFDKKHAMNCSVCGKVCMDEKDLQEHMKSHSINQMARCQQNMSQQIEEEFRDTK